MKRLYYYSEKTKYLHISLLLVYLFLIICSFSMNNKTGIVIFITAFFLHAYEASEGIILLYKKHICISKGQQFEGRIVGKIGISTLRKGYFYKLIVLYSNGKISTPFIRTKYADALKSRKCVVNIHNNLIYINGYTLCSKGDTPIKIRIVENK